MIEIRRIVAGEAEEFLGLLCGVFHLDISRARPVFYDTVLFDLARKWALFEDGRMVSILTTTGLTFGWGRCVGIAGVATLEEHQGKGHAQRLLEHVLGVAETEGEGPAMLFAHQETLYRRVGFVLKDEVIRASIQTTKMPPGLNPYSNSEVQHFYRTWSEASVDRLVRTHDRWRYWGLACRICEPFMDGYACVEPGLLREAVAFQAAEKWPVPAGSDWYGLRSVTKACAVPIKRPVVELLFMTRDVPGQPEMFMTDQF